MSDKYNGLYVPKHDCPTRLLQEQYEMMERYMCILEERAIIESIDLEG